MISPSVTAIVEQYKKNQNASNSKLKKSSMLIKSNDKVEAQFENNKNEVEKCAEENIKVDLNANRKSSIDSKNTKIFDEPISNYIRPDKGPQFYSTNRSRTAPLEDRLDIGEGGYKTNSDIYPVIGKNQLMNQSHDLCHEMRELKLFEGNYNRPIRQSKSSLEVEQNFDEQYSLINKPYGVKHDIELIETNFKTTQVNENDLSLNVRELMEDLQKAKRLEISEMLAEKLVSCALIAGCTDNITVNCVLFPRCNF